MKTSTMVKLKSRLVPYLIDAAVLVLCVLFAEWREYAATGTSLAGSILATLPAVFGALPAASGLTQVLALLTVPLQQLLAYLCTVTLQSFFVPVVYLAFFSARIRVNIEKQYLASPQGIYYYRSIFPNLKPATVSMLADLEIQQEKDVTASLLQMVSRGLLDITPTGLAPTNAAQTADDADRELLRLVRGETQDLSRWKQLSEQEALNAGYLRSSSPHALRQYTKMLWRWWLLCLAVSVAFSFTVTGQVGNINFFERTLAALGSASTMAAYIPQATFAADMLLSLLFWVVAVAMFALVALPVYIYFFNKKYTTLNAPVRRTRRGEKLARQIQGLKNYIHDFTLLDEAGKEKVVLWDDFLVYAIVLEENVGIVKEISTRYPAIKLSVLHL